MGKGRVVGGAILPVVLCIIIQMLLWLPPQARGEDAAASMPAYCSIPPLPGLGIKPNLLLLIDNSASMYDLAFTDPGIFCLDDSFAPGGNYPGYFQQDKLYRYDSVSQSFMAASGASIDPSSCNQAGTPFFCVNLDVKKKADRFLATGKFLNWLAMSKLDLEKLALTGGKYDPASGRLQAESRGCQGKRYVKIVNDSNGVPLPVTFGVRGPIPSESGYVSQSSHGGPTRIDIYPAKYNTDDCLKAVREWQEGGSDLAYYAGRCLGPLYDANNVPTPGKIFTEALSLCYSHRAGAPILPGEVTQLQADCATRYQRVYGATTVRIVKNAGDDICAGRLYHELRNHDGIIFTNGYLGQCYKTTGGGSWLSNCTPYVMEDFCSELQDPWLADPSGNANQAGTKASLPSFILDAGITSLGSVALTAQVRFAPAAPPTGLVQQFAADINFGAMIFNDDGAGSECGGAINCLKHCTNMNDPVPHSECSVDSDCDGPTPYSGVCRADTPTDGGRIISYINQSAVGDHSPGSGLVAAIDAIRGTSWTPVAESFYEAIGYFAGNASFRLQAGDYDTAYPPSKYSCQRNNVLILSDGMSTADRVAAMTGFVETALTKWGSGSDPMPAGQITAPGTAATAAPENGGSYNLDDLAWLARHRNIIDTARPIELQREYITTHVVYTGPPCGDLKSTSIPKTGYNADGSCATTDEGVPEKMMQLTAAKGGGSISSVKDPAGLQNALKSVFMQVRGGSNAGSGSTILATGEGNGAIFLQPQFYPSKSFDGGGTSAAWIGELQGLWYNIDSFVGGSSGAASGIREDTREDRVFDLTQDRMVDFTLDTSLNEARARLSVDDDGDGKPDVPQPTGYPRSVVPEAVQSLWRAGLQLCKRDAADRTIYTQTGGGGLVTFLDTSLAANRQLLLAQDRAEADRIVSFVKGVDDIPEQNPDSSRNRTLKPYGESSTGVWKLGDIISSTPVLQSAVPLGSYHLLSPRGYGDASYGSFIKPTGAYARRGTVYVGANDGMLHAFRLGVIKVHPDEGETWPVTRKAKLAGTELGKEEWAFVPHNALPYLRYLKEPLYRHLYYVDGAVTLVDASIGDPARCSRDEYWNCPMDKDTGSNWRTILVGGMGLGGASRPADDNCNAATCVKAPAGSIGGLSSYFALDVTGQNADNTGGGPRFLWEFSHPELGFATSGSAILRVKARSATANNAVIHDPDKNGRWFAVFASGPTGAVDGATRQFTGVSNQRLKLFVVDLNAVPPLTQGRNYWVIDTGIDNAFGGSMAGAGIDADRWDGSSDTKLKGNYEDDAVYVGYTRADGGGGWTGGVLRLFTREDPDPATWKTSKVIDGVGPVTTSVGKLQDRQYKRLWLYFGTGRYFNSQDDLSAGRALYAVSEPCYGSSNTFKSDTESCSATPVRLSELTDVTDVARIVAVKDQGDGYKGWRISLEAASGNLASERVVDNPISLTGGAVFFTTYQPSLDLCQDGVSYLWGVHYSTGGPMRSVSAQALLPLANGSSANLDAAALPDRGQRRSPPQLGKALKPRLVTNSGLKPLKKIIHVQER